MGMAGRLLMGTAAGVFVAGIGGIVCYTVLNSMVPEDSPVWAEVRCRFDMARHDDQKCFTERVEEGIKAEKVRYQKQEEELRSKVAELDGQVALQQGMRDQLLKEKTALERKSDELKERLDKLAKIESSVTSFSLFTHKRWRNETVVTGIEYSSFVADQQWTKSWCYVMVVNKDGVSIQIDLAKQLSGASVEPSPISAAELEAARMTREEVDAARMSCMFPGGAS